MNIYLPNIFLQATEKNSDRVIMAVKDQLAYLLFSQSIFFVVVLLFFTKPYFYPHLESGGC